MMSTLIKKRRSCTLDYKTISIVQLTFSYKNDDISGKQKYVYYYIFLPFQKYSCFRK